MRPEAAAGDDDHVSTVGETVQALRMGILALAEQETTTPAVV